MPRSIAHLVFVASSLLSLLGCPADSATPRVDPRSQASPTATRTPRPEGAPPNVILIVVDTLRADHLSHYGYARATAAPLDRFRSEATLFSRAYSTAPWTGPSTMSIHTGLSTLRHGGNAHGDALPPEAETLAERLSAAGYATHGISFNHNVSRKTGFDQGFDAFDDYLGKATAYPDIEKMVSKVDDWLAEVPREPYFLYLHPMNVHGPYRVPEERQSTLLGHPPSRDFKYYGAELMAPLMRKGRLDLRERVTPAMLESLTDQYDVAVHYSMEQIAAMLKAIEAQGLLDDSVVILTADHGEELFDHGGFSHGFTLHREVIHVPLYVHRPGQDAPATEDRVVSTLDIVPTILELAELPPVADLDGIPLFGDPGEGSRERVLVQHTAWAARAEGLSMIQGSDHLIDMFHSYDTPDPTLELFDVVEDPQEQVDLVRMDSERIASLRSRLEERVAQLTREEHLAAPVNVLQDMDIEMLRALGYVE
jgi:arylsulfatase A-like enzyme